MLPAHVPEHRVFPDCRVVTFGALLLAPVWCSVYTLLMVAQRYSVIRTESAFVADEQLTEQVLALVIVQLCAVDRTEYTLVTAVGPHTRMSLLMRPNVSTSLACVRAVTTCKLS